MNNQPINCLNLINLIFEDLYDFIIHVYCQSIFIIIQTRVTSETTEKFNKTTVILLLLLYYEENALQLANFYAAGGGVCLNKGVKWLRQRSLNIYWWYFSKKKKKMLMCNYIVITSPHSFGRFDPPQRINVQLPPIFFFFVNTVKLS